MIVVYVHGNANKIRADLLKRQWDQALFGRDLGEGSRMAHRAPLLHPDPLPDPEFDEIERPAPEESEAAPTPAAPVAGGARGAVVRAYDVSLTGVAPSPGEGD